MQTPTELDFDLDSYAYELPERLIASRPSEKRGESKLLVYHAKTNQIEHRFFYELPAILPQETLLILNQTKVIPCRLLGNKASGGKVEILVLEFHSTNNSVECLIKTSSKKKIGDQFYIGKDKKSVAEIKTITDRGTFLVHFSLEKKQNLIQFLETEGMIPLPPYIRSGESDEQDKRDYQTVFATNPGSVAAPTAGLHFTDEIFANLKKAKHDYDFVNLHVGVGTFKPIEAKNILEHKMHQEFFEVNQRLLDKMSQQARPIIPVGTTSFRVLQSHFELQQTTGMTQCYVYPGKKITPIISGLITNFHLPKSSLLVLVAALIGREKALELYELAKSHNYRFYSYGDAMLILLR